MEPLLTIVNLTKQLGTLTVLQDITFTLHRGEVIGLAGHSDAGKSVLVKILAGLSPPTSGNVYFAGQKLRWSHTSQHTSIAVIHQEPDLADNLDITENIFLGNEIGWSRLGRWLLVPNRIEMDEQATQILAQLDAHLPNLEEKVANLSGEQRQLVAIAQAMAKPARLILVDDPAGLIRYDYQQRLLGLIQRWQRQGSAVLFSSNNLEHLLAVTDRIIILRRGRQVAVHRTDEASREQLVAELVGASHDQLTPAGWALENYYRVREQADKLRFRQTLLEKNLVAQDTLNRQLVEQLGEQVAALAQVNQALQATQRRLLTEREEERKHLARELHDQVIQDLLSVNYELEEIETNLETDTEMHPELGAELHHLRAEIRALVEDVRRICGNLRPPTIDSLGLGAAIQSYLVDWQERTNIPVHLELDPNLGRLPEAIELSIFRIVQEGLSNIRRHAEATLVDVYLKHTSPRTLMLSIADNGRGLAADFDLAHLSPDGHYGLVGISERVALMGGYLKIQNQAGRGVILRAEIPHPRVEPEETA
ncbi:MAG: ATP-binding cassette domain-containing protein [Caldilineaceae bacterium]|nr:ATP-binding cassette domain-containing protein [Caldilineaceae bacterium]